MTGKPDSPEAANGPAEVSGQPRVQPEARKVGIGDRRVPATAHFQFKIAEPKKPTWHKWAILGAAIVGGLGLAVGALFVTGVL